MSDLLSNQNKSFTSEELNNSRHAINRTFSSDSSGADESLLDVRMSQIEMLEAQKPGSVAEPGKEFIAPEIDKSVKLDAFISKVNKNMPKAMAKKDYTVVELKDELDKARYDAVDMGKVKGKRTRDKENNVDNHSEGYMAPLVNAIDGLQSKLSKKVTRNTLDNDLSDILTQYGTIQDAAEKYLSKRKNPHTDEGKARKKMVQLILKKLDNEKLAIMYSMDRKGKNEILFMLDEGYEDVSYSDILMGAGAEALKDVKMSETKHIEGVGALVGDDVIVNDDVQTIELSTNVSELIKMTMKETDDELERLKPEVEAILKEHERNDLLDSYRYKPNSENAALYKVVLRYEHFEAVRKMKDRLYEAVKEIEDKGDAREVREIFTKGTLFSLNDVKKRMTGSGVSTNYEDTIKPAFKSSKLYYIYSNANESSFTLTDGYNEYITKKEDSNASAKAKFSMNARLYGSSIADDSSKMLNDESVYDKKSYQKELDELKEAEEARAKYFERSDDDYFALYRATMDIQKLYKRTKEADEQKIYGKKNLSQRKVGVSILAEALDMKDLVEEARFAETKIDGKKKLSVITSPSADKTVDEAMTEVDSLGMKFRYSTGALKDRMSITALDLICGNIDRLQKDIKGSFEAKGDGTVEMTKVKAVSNEFSFGMARLDTDYNVARVLPVLDIKTANQILWLKTSFLDYYLSGILSKNEIEAAKGRLKTLKSVIRKQMKEGAAGAPKILYTDKDWEDFRKEFETTDIKGTDLDNRLKGSKRCVGHGKVHN